MGACHSIDTVGHPTRGIPEFVTLLTGAGVDLVVDVRTVPRSRTNPLYNANMVAGTLASSGIGCRHVRAPGDLRKQRATDPASINTSWQNASFRSYADYAATPEFHQGLAELLDLAGDHPCIVMCAEAVWWRCHRRIIADHLIVVGEDVRHIMGPGRIERASLTPAAQPMPGGTWFTHPGCQSASKVGSSALLVQDKQGI